ncbi:ATP-binding protein [Streptomyces sp. CRN 30]|uniref:ATP-binding protein n=1 Tax=Streptomyces sp. CRN 30 TaxID=3075613 RepID=UPI002A813D32|nr:ATP-binding protein [Streptomyces sp. CRN 30]
MERRTTGDGSSSNAADPTNLRQGAYGARPGTHGAAPDHCTQRVTSNGGASGNGTQRGAGDAKVPGNGGQRATSNGGSSGNAASVRAAVPGSRTPTGGVRPGNGAAGEAARTSVTITNAGAARQYVRSVVQDHWYTPGRRVEDQAVIDLLLVVSELVTNAIRHGGGIAGFEVTPTGGGVRLSVRDHSDVVPAAAYGPGTLPSTHVGHGYGWPLIIRLARDIDIRPGREGGKTISVYVPLTG